MYRSQTKTHPDWFGYPQSNELAKRLGGTRETQIEGANDGGYEVVCLMVKSLIFGIGVDD